MRHAVTITVGAALLVAASYGSGTSSDGAAAAVDAPVVTTSYVLFDAPATMRATRPEADPRCPANTRCAPGPNPRIGTFGNGAGSGATTFGQGQGANTKTTAGTGPFGKHGGPSVGQ